jgi:hypothetical protein
MSGEFIAFQAASRADAERAEIPKSLPCRIAARLGAPVALQQSRILPTSIFILPFPERS